MGAEQSSSFNYNLTDFDYNPADLNSNTGSNNFGRHKSNPSLDSKKEVQQQNLLNKDLLFHSFVYDRINLHKVLAGDNGQGFTYEELRKCLKDIEEQYIDDNEYYNKSVVQTLMQGKCGDIQNIQMALYELPTKELLDGICELCNILNINKVEEIMGGMGLLSYMLSLRNINVKCTDGFAWSQTNGIKKYYDVEKKRLIKYNLDKNMSDDTLYIMAWPHPQKPQDIDIQHFFGNTRPKYLLIIIENMIINNGAKVFDTFIKTQEYHSIKLPFKQLCYRDYFCDRYTSVTKTSYQRSSSVLYVDKRKIINVPDYKSQISENNFTQDIYDVYPEVQYVQDLIVEGIVPHFCFDANVDDVKKEMHLVIHSKIVLPTYLNSFEEFKFFNTKIKSPRKYPINIITRKDFEKYYALITKLKTEGVDSLKNSGYLPDWLVGQNINILAEMYIFTDFSTTRKFWKTDLASFEKEFRRLNATINTIAIPSGYY